MMDTDVDMDVEDCEYNKLLDKLAQRLKIARHPENAITVEAAKLLIEEVISDQLNKDTKGDDSNDKNGALSIQTSKFNVADIPLPKFLTEKCAQQIESEPSSLDRISDANILEHSAKCLKLLYLEDQRQLQNQVNQTIASIQSLTANPKTDMKQMAVGR